MRRFPVQEYAMSLIRPFAALRPVPGHANDVVAPPYDVLSTSEARSRAQGRPWSFLHISRPEIDLPEDTDPYDDVVYAKGAENLSRMIEQNILQRETKPCYYIYRLVMGEYTQVGLVATGSVAAYDQQRILRHEYTRPDKEADRVRQIEALNAQTGPVFLTYRHTDDIDSLVASIIGLTPEYDITADDGVQHTIWVVDDDAMIEQFTALFEKQDHLYIADGHHRSAAASRVAAHYRSKQDEPDTDASYEYFLAVLFPDNQMHILDYNRVVNDLNGLTEAQFIDRISANFSVETSAAAVRPGRAGVFGMYLPGKWYRLAIRPELVTDDPVARLDVSLLSDHLIAPVLGITDTRTDKRIDFVGGIRGLGELEKRVNAGGMAVAFSLFPTSLEDLMAVADAGQVMPPKSTWFEPKLADGLLSHVLD